MDAGQLWLLFVVMFSASIVCLLVFVLIPSLAKDRFVLEMGEARDDIEDLQAKALHDVERGALDELDHVVVRLLQAGAPPVSFLASGALLFRRQLKQGRTPVTISEPARRLRTEAGCQYRVVIDNIERRVIRESFRATIMGGRYWLVFGPVWIIARRGLADDTAPIADFSVERSAEKTLLEAVDAMETRGKVLAFA